VKFAPAWVLCLGSLLLALPSLADDVPLHNQKALRAPPPLPALGDATDRAQRLLEAIKADKPELAHSFFLPREAFRLIKASKNPDALYDRLLAAFDRDIHALHAELKTVSFVRLELSRRREWVLPFVEANHLPYWAQRHNWLVVSDGKRERRIEVRVLIAWDDRWYVTHLSEFRRTAKSPR